MNTAHCTWIATVAALVSGCLSIDIVPQIEPDGGRGGDAASPDVDAAPPDVEGSPRDAEVELSESSVPSDAEPVPVPPPTPGSEGGSCLADGVPAGVTGLPLRCGTGLACGDALCIVPPPCAQGVRGPCGIVLPTGSDLTAWVSAPDALYWTQFGSLDAFGNYDGQGAIWRIRYGVWEPELVAGGLGLFDQATRTYIRPDLRVKDGYVLWRSDVGTQAVPVDESRGTPFALAGEPGEWCFVGNVGYRFARRRVFKRVLDENDDGIDQYVLADPEFSAGVPCFADRHTLINRDGVSVAIADDGSASRRTEVLEAPVLYADDTYVVSKLRDDFASRRIRDETGALGVGRSLGGQASLFSAVFDGALYFSGRTSPCDEQSAAVLRVPLDGSSPPQHVASLVQTENQYICLFEAYLAGAALIARKAALQFDFDFLYQPFAEVSP